VLTFFYIGNIILHVIIVNQKTSRLNFSLPEKATHGESCVKDEV